MKKSSRTSKILFRLHPKLSSYSRHNKLFDVRGKNLAYYQRIFDLQTLASMIIDLRN